MNDHVWEQKFAELAKASGMNTLSEAQRAELMSAFAEHSSTRPSLLERFVATLSFDSFAELGLEGARESYSADTRQLFYICPLGDIALDFMQQSDGCLLTGQLFFSRENQPFTVTIVRDGDIVATTTTKSRNNFRLLLASGVADLTLANENQSVTLKNVPLELARGK